MNWKLKLQKLWKIECVVSTRRAAQFAGDCDVESLTNILFKSAGIHILSDCFVTYLFKIRNIQISK